MEIRWVAGGEAVDLLNPLIEKRNKENPDALPWVLLNDRTCSAFVAFEGEFVLGFFVQQLMPTLGPLYVESFTRNGEVSAMLVKEMIKFLVGCRGVVVVAENAATERMCRMQGMKKVEYPVYVSGEIR